MLNNQSRLLLTDGEIKNAAILFLIFFVIYSYEITNFNLSIDEELFAYEQGSSIFVQLGRWVFPFAREILWPQIVTPLGPYLFFGACISFSYLYILRAFEIRQPHPFHFVSFAAYILSPVWIAQLEFVINVIPLGIGLLSVAVAVYLSVNKGKAPDIKTYGTIVFLCAIAIGSYQSLILSYLVFVGGILLRQYVLGKQFKLASFIKQLLIFFLIALLSIAVYLLTAKLMLSVYGVEPNAYARHFVRFDLFFQDPLTVVKIFLSNSADVYIGWWQEFGGASYVFAATIIVGSFSILTMAADSANKFVVASCSVTGILLLPASYVLMTGAPLELRVFLAVPPALLSILFLGYQSYDRLLRATIFSLALFLVLEGLYIHSIYLARAWVIQKHDLLMAIAINGDVMRLTNFGDEKEIQIDFSGLKHPRAIYPNIPTTASGSSFFEWDGGSPKRIVRYFNMIGFHNYIYIGEKKHEELAAQYKSMPSWPKMGSIKMADGVVLVKLSN